MIFTTLVMSYILYADYAKNNYSFWRKDLYLSNVERHEYETIVECNHDSYKHEMSHFEECSPKECFRHYTDFLINPDEAEIIRNIAINAFKKGQSAGGASIIDITSKTVIDKGILRYERDDFFSDNDIKIILNLKTKIIKHLSEKFGIKKFYTTKPIFFSKLNNQEPILPHDIYWNRHTDKNIFKSTQFIAHVQLSTYLLEFKGGRFNFINTDNYTMTSIQPKLGRILFYTSGGENEYYIERVEYGESLSLTIPFTCNSQLEVHDQDL